MASDFTVKLAEENETTTIHRFLLEHFFGKSPLCMIFKIKDHVSVEECPPLFSQTSSDFVVKAVTSQEEDELIGVALVQEQPVSWRKTDSAEGKNLLNFVKFAKSEGSLEDLPDKTTSLFIVAVRQDWCGRGVARRLIEESMRQARARGFLAMKISCSSEFTARLVRSLGWREYYRLAYKDYPRLSGVQISLTSIPPHEHLRYFVTEL